MNPAARYDGTWILYISLHIDEANYIELVMLWEYIESAYTRICLWSSLGSLPKIF